MAHARTWLSGEPVHMMCRPMQHFIENPIVVGHSAISMCRFKTNLACQESAMKDLIDVSKLDHVQALGGTVRFHCVTLAHDDLPIVTPCFLVHAN